MDEPIDFWSFSLSVYSKPGVARACLALQEELGIDVNVLLYCFWYGKTRGSISEQDLHALLEFTDEWSSALVQPLRSARSWLKNEGCDFVGLPHNDCEGLRQRILDNELASERLQQLAMESMSIAPSKLVPFESQQAEAVSQNIMSYWRTLEIAISEESQAHLVVLLSAVFPGIDPIEVANCLRTLGR